MRATERGKHQYLLNVYVKKLKVAVFLRCCCCYCCCWRHWPLRADIYSHTLAVSLWGARCCPSKQHCCDAKLLLLLLCLFVFNSFISLLLHHVSSASLIMRLLVLPHYLLMNMHALLWQVVGCMLHVACGSCIVWPYLLALISFCFALLTAFMIISLFYANFCEPLRKFRLVKLNKSSTMEISSSFWLIEITEITNLLRADHSG